MLLSSGDVQGAAFYLCRGYSSLMVVGGVYSTGTGGVSLFGVEGTLLRCNVQGLLYSCGGRSLSSTVRWLLSCCGHGLLLSYGISLFSSSGGNSWFLSSCCLASSGGSLWRGCSLYLWHLGLLTSFHGSTLVVRVSSYVTSKL